MPEEPPGTWCGSKCKGGAAAAMAAAAAANWGAGIFDGIRDEKDYCLNPSKTSENIAANIAKQTLNMFGGMGDSIFSAGGYRSPLDKMQDQISTLNNKYRKQFDSFTQTFAKIQTSFDEDVVSSMELLSKNNTILDVYYKEILQEKITLNTIRIVFLFIFVFIIYLYIVW